jgi:hypothetical protein
MFKKIFKKIADWFHRNRWWLILLVGIVAAILFVTWAFTSLDESEPKTLSGKIIRARTETYDPLYNMVISRGEFVETRSVVGINLALIKLNYFQWRDLIEVVVPRELVGSFQKGDYVHFLNLNIVGHVHPTANLPVAISAKKAARLTSQGFFLHESDSK